MARGHGVLAGSAVTSVEDQRGGPPALVAVAQMTAGDSVEANLATCTAFFAEAQARGAALVVLPENFAFFGPNDAATQAVAAPLDGPLFSSYRTLCARFSVAAIFGGFPELNLATGRRFNACVHVDAAGEIAAVYRKVHLFDVALADRSYRESGSTDGGTELVVTSTPVGQVGLSVCYDLRFPEMYQALTAAGAEVLVVPAAFTLQTGKDHWEPLLRARAIENQCYVLAAAQVGLHHAKRETWGHAMVVDPWGTITAQASDGPGLVIAPLERARVTQIRSAMPVASHRRPGVYAAPVRRVGA